MIKQKIILKRLLTILISIMLICTTVSADTGSTETGTGFGSGTSGYYISKGVSGVKLSILRVPVGEQNGKIVSAYEAGYIMPYTPLSAKAGYKDFMGLKSSHAIYFLNDTSVTAEGIPSGDVNAPVALMDVKNYIVYGSGKDYTTDTSLANSIDTVIDALKVDWAKGTPDLESQLTIKDIRNMPDGVARQQAIAHNQQVFRGLGTIIAKKYGTGVANKFATDGVAMSDENEYIFMLEPIYSYVIGGKEVLVTTSNMARAYTLTDGKDIANDKNFVTSWDNTKASSLYQANRANISKFNNLFSVALGKNTDNWADGNGGYSFASKIFYNGPKSHGAASGYTYATKADKKISFGLLRSADYINNITPSPFKIVEVFDRDDGTHIETTVNPLIVAENGDINIKDKGDSLVKEWFTSTTDPKSVTTDSSWAMVTTYYKDATTTTGTTTTTLDAETLEKPIYLFVHYVEKAPITGAGSTEAQYISFQKTLEDLKLSPWDIQTGVKWDPNFGVHLHKIADGCGCTGHKDSDGYIYYCSSISCCKGDHPCAFKCYTDNTYDLTEELANKLKEDLVAPDSGIYKFLYDNNLKAGTVDPLPKFKDLKLQTVMHRGQDRVTLAQYVKKAGQSQAIADLSIINYNASNLPTPSLRKASSYKDNETYLWDLKDKSADIILKALCTADKVHEGEIIGKDSRDFRVDIAVYRDKENKGLEKVTPLSTSQVEMDGKTIKNLSSTSYAEPSFWYYPYVKMLYETSYKQKQTAYVLSDEKSYYQANDYVEIGWTKQSTDNMAITSNQFTTHRAATNGSESWKQQDMVLPGGAIFGVKSTSNTTVGLRTYLTYIPSDILASTPEYSYNSNRTGLDSLKAVDKANIHASLLNSLIDRLEVLNTEMLVNKDWNANVLTSTNSIVANKTTSAIDLKKLGSAQTKLSQDNKYWLQADVKNGKSTKNSEGDFDTANVNTTKRYLKVDSDVYGKVNIYASNDGVNWGIKGSYGANQDITSILDALPTEFKEANDKTKFISNFVNSISRTGGWYNEAWDGICVLVSTSTLDFGLMQPNLRVATLDPKLTPKQSNTSNMFSDAYSFAFRTENKQVSLNFGDSKVAIKNVKDMQTSNKKYIPNVTTQDLDAR